MRFKTLSDQFLSAPLPRPGIPLNCVDAYLREKFLDEARAADALWQRGRKESPERNLDGEAAEHVEGRS